MPEVFSNFSEEAVGPTPDRQKEIDDLLALAETLQEKVDQWSREVIRIAMWGATFMLAGVAGLLAFLLSALSTKSDGHMHGFFTPGFAVGTLTALFCSGYSLFLQHRAYVAAHRKRREQYALEEVISLLREIEQAYSKDQHWSALERATFRIRLSRFAVGRTRGVVNATF